MEEILKTFDLGGIFSQFDFSNPGASNKHIDLSNYNVSYFYLTEFEKNFDKFAAVEQIKKYYWLCFPMVFLYLIVIFGIQELMKERPGFKLQMPLFLWNFLLAVFSFVIFFRSLHELVYTVYHYGLGPAICLSRHKVFMDSPVILLYAYLFTTSKVVELGDTLFIVLRKRKLTFLHWYHHSTVLVFCWLSFPYCISTARMFAAMNSFVHTIMYTYFAVAALNIKIPRRVAMAITCCQISQMVFGTCFNVWAYFVKNAGNTCDVTYWNIYTALLIYSSYVVLFTNFFIQAYMKEMKIGQYVSSKEQLKKRN